MKSRDKTPINKIIKRPHQKFNHEQVDDWVDYVYELGLRSLTFKNVAAKLGVHINTIRHYPQLQNAMLEGQADHVLTIEHELLTDATNDPAFIEDPVERAGVRQSKIAALKILKISADKRESFTTPQEQERLRRLSDDELQTEIDKHIVSRGRNTG